MNDSILISIKKLLGIAETDTSFDADLIIHINSAFMVLTQLGITNASFSITGNSETWSNYLSNRTNLDSVKTYVFMKVKLIFDPPASSSALDALNRLISEFEWRLYTEVDTFE